MLHCVFGLTLFNIVYKFMIYITMVERGLSRSLSARASAYRKMVKGHLNYISYSKLATFLFYFYPFITLYTLLGNGIDLADLKLPRYWLEAMFQ